jgi:opacity protein-like surface antigen
VNENPQDSPDRGRFSVTLGAGIKNISEDIYETVFGKNNLIYGIDLAYRVTSLLEIFLHSDYFSTNGESTFTKEDTRLTIFPLELGARIIGGKKNFKPYGGLGAGLYQYKDEMDIEGTTYQIKDNPFGFFIEAGLRYYFSQKFFLNVQGKYLFLKVQPDSPQLTGPDVLYVEERTLGGFNLLAGLGITF